jgi:hypothetical protein
LLFEFLNSFESTFAACQISIDRNSASSKIGLGQNATNLADAVQHTAKFYIAALAFCAAAPTPSEVFSHINTAQIPSAFATTQLCLISTNGLINLDFFSID